MVKKEFHILTVGNSLVANYQRRGADDERIRGCMMGDPLWQDLLKDKAFLNRIYDFLREAPRKNSAEINTLFRYCDERKVGKEMIEVYLAGTKTASNEIALVTLQRYFKDAGITPFTPFQVPGYLEESPSVAASEFEGGMSAMLDRFIYFAMKKREEGYRVVFNPTGGFKAHVITCALAGFLTGLEVYYIHEEFNDLILFPPFFYLPKGEEIRVLERLVSFREPLSGMECRNLLDEFPHEIERLDRYGLVEIESDEFRKEPFRIRVTSRGKWANQYLKERV